MENKQSSKIITLVLGALLLFALGYSFYSNSKHSALQAELESEKAEIKAELDELVVKYDAKIAENTTMNAKLVAARQDIVSYRDSLKSEKAASYSAIKRYKSRVYTMQKKNKELFTQIEELTAKNEELNKEIVAAKEIIQTKEEEEAELKAENEALAAKVAIASELAIQEFEAVSMKKKSSGALKSTTRAKYTDAFRVSFKIGQNAVTEGGDKEAYIIIKDFEGVVIAPKGKVTINEEEVYYSDTTTIDYQNIATDVIIITDVNRKENKKGLYTISAVLNGKTVGETTVTLK
ncbi:hypothetical protein [Flavicella marina]|uniref:hypothetical protein n=1 Tax=Flavicella marina TaxID=1475951 RepID=UPI001263ECEE|nr:hypothetical protein [Flavicella marina]